MAAAGSEEPRRAEERLLRDVSAMARLLEERPPARARLRAALGIPLADQLVFALGADHRRPPRAVKDSA